MNLQKTIFSQKIKKLQPFLSIFFGMQLEQKKESCHQIQIKLIRITILFILISEEEAISIFLVFLMDMASMAI